MSKKEAPLVASKDEIIVHQPEGGEFHIEVRVENETVWLTQAQMAELFQKDRTIVGRHIRNIYKEGELEKSITCANFAHMGADAAFIKIYGMAKKSIIIIDIFSKAESSGYACIDIAEVKYFGS